MSNLTALSPVLVANRGEIAARIAWTCRSLGLEVVGVYTVADADMPHPGAMDRSMRIEDYLDGDEIIRAAKAMGARSVHPGFGFLAENAGFAAKVVEAGLVWIGPGVDAIEVMGSKRGARQRVAADGVSVVPGYDGEAQDDACMATEAERIGFPLLVKASAGGGGKGMAVVSALSELPAALEQARRVSLAAFGDDQLLLERFIDGGRHVEVQILADMHGQTVHLLERECSIQRRRQKIVEEAPSPACMADEALRERLCQDAIRAAKAVNYVGAGTVEFMVTDQGDHYFLEMNTRLQVEHPVTEAITGLDLVEQQLRVAAGQGIESVAQLGGPDGHAIEVRIYAEDPDNGYLPSTGRILAWSLPILPGIRVDSGVQAGSEIGISYDPMLAKIIAHGRDREEARRLLLRALNGMVVHGLTTNREQLIRILDNEAFIEGRTPTSFLEVHAGALTPGDPTPLRQQAAVCATVLDWASRQASASGLPGLRGGYRSNPWPAPPVRWEVGADQFAYCYRVKNGRPGQTEGTCLEFSTERLWTEDLRAWMSEETEEPAERVQVVVRSIEPQLVLEIDGLRVARDWFRNGPVTWISGLGCPTQQLRRLPDFPEPGAQDSEGGCVAPMPGKVVKICVEVGQSVEAGAELVVLEAMKMEQAVRAPNDGIVAELLVESGEQVDGGAVLLRLEEVD